MERNSGNQLMSLDCMRAIIIIRHGFTGYPYLTRVAFPTVNYLYE